MTSETSTSGARRSPWIPLFARGTAAVTLLLLIAGGLVTSQGAGMAVPDWPTTFGYNMFLFPLRKMVGGVFFEHSHRLLGSAVGMLTIGLAVAIWKGDERRWMRVLGGIALVAVIVQGVIGGLRVVENATLLALVHGSFAHAFFALMICILVATHAIWDEALESRRVTEAASGVRFAAVATAGLVYVQVVLGAVLRHTGGSLRGHVWIAAAVTLAVFLLRGRLAELASNGPAARAVGMVRNLVVLQVALGVAAYFAKLVAPVPAEAPFSVVVVTVLHQVNGAGIFAAAVATALLTYRSLTPEAIRTEARDLSTRPTTDAAARPELAPRMHRIEDFFELTKPRLVLLVLLTTMVGFYLALVGPMTWGSLVAALAGTTLCAAGSQALNQFVEREGDALMRRTKTRPLPEGRVLPAEGFAFGVALAVLGLGILWLGTNPLATGLAALTVVTYLFAYTPLKTRTPLATLVGCVPGALPPLIGWAAAGAHVGVAAWTLFAILFFWQVPHSLAIAFLYRADYERAGCQLLPVVEPDGKSTGRQVLLNCMALLAVSLAPSVIGLAGGWYFACATVTGLIVLVTGVRFARHSSTETARAVLFSSYLALTVQLAVLAIDKLD